MFLYDFLKVLVKMYYKIVIMVGIYILISQERFQMQKMQNNFYEYQSIQTLSFDCIKSGKFLSNKRVKSYRKRLYAWSTEENYLYMSYLKILSKYFNHSTMAKMFRLFSRMSKMIKTRCPNQIKSHHQKMMMKHKSIENAIKFIELELSYELYESQSLFNHIKELSEYVDNYLKIEKNEVAILLQNNLRKLQKKQKQHGRAKRQDLSSQYQNDPKYQCYLNMSISPQQVKIQEDPYQIYKFTQGNLAKNTQSQVMCKIETQ